MDKNKLKYMYFLFKYGSIKLNLNDAKGVKKLADKLISLCIRNKNNNTIDDNFYRLLSSKVKSKYIASLLLNVLIYDLGTFKGGCVRIIKNIVSLKTPLKMSSVSIIFDSSRN